MTENQPGLEYLRSQDVLIEPYDFGYLLDGSGLVLRGRDGEVVVAPVNGAPPLQLQYRDVTTATVGPRGSQVTVATADGTIWRWDEFGSFHARLCTLRKVAQRLVWSPDGRRLCLLDDADQLHVWDSRDEKLTSDKTGYRFASCNPRWSPDGEMIYAADERGTIWVHSGADLRGLNRWQGRGDYIRYIAVTRPGDRVALASSDGTVRIHDSAGGREVVTLEGHGGSVACVKFSADDRFMVSTADPDEIILWRCRDWTPVATLRGSFGGMSFHPADPVLAVGPPGSRHVDFYRLDYAVLGRLRAKAGTRRYANAKVVLLGDSGVGKSGLGLVLSGQPYAPTDSTHGRNVWTMDPAEGREILLWDLAGQPGYRLTHQLHLNEVAVALVVFDSRSETDPFAGVRYWARALAQARRLEGDGAVPIRTFLVAARADRYGIGASKVRIQAVLAELGFDAFFETSAREGWQVGSLGDAIRDGIDWERLPMVSSSELFGAIKAFLLGQRRLLATADELRADFAADVEADEFAACVARLESRGLVTRLGFGNYVLLRPEVLDAYASALVMAAKQEPDGLGCIAQEAALSGNVRMPDSERIADRGQERLLLIATVEELLRHEIALKASTEHGVQLVFPSEFTRELPGVPDVRGAAAILAFEGPLSSVYATLAVRLSHSDVFERKEMWQNTAAYTCASGGLYGLHLREVEEGRGELVLYYDDQAPAAVRQQFEAYVTRHLSERAINGTITRRPVLSCQRCGRQIADDIVQARVARGASTLRCPYCDDCDMPLAGAPADVAGMDRSADARRDQNAAALRVRGKRETGDYDVFLSYNAKDVRRVAAVAEQLQQRGILPWFDKVDMPAGVRVQQELARRLAGVKAIAVFIGAAGPGPWQSIEVETAVEDMVKAGKLVIPVMLPGKAGQPALPPILRLLNAVDLRKRTEFDRLVSAIKREQPPGLL